MILTNIKTFGEIQDSTSNPFLEELHVDKRIVLKRFKKGEVIVPDESNITLQHSEELSKENEKLKEIGLEIGKRQYKQRATFVLLYSQPILNYKALSEASFKVLFFIIDKKLSLGIDYVILSIPECCVELEMSRPTISKAFVELVNQKLIAKRADGVWWINPNYFYAGNRLKILTK